LCHFAYKIFAESIIIKTLKSALYTADVTATGGRQGDAKPTDCNLIIEL
jgi:bifunctional DNase/RNase